MNRRELYQVIPKMRRCELFQVTRDEFNSLVDELKSYRREIATDEDEIYNILRIYSTKTHRLLCEKYVPREVETEELYYIYNLPDDDERGTPKIRRKVVLETQEEVQAFFDIISKIQKGELK